MIEANVALLWVQIEFLTALWILVIVKTDSLLNKVVPIYKRKLVKKLSSTVLLDVCFGSKVDNFVEKCSLFGLDLVAIDLSDPFSGKFSYDVCQYLLVFLLLVEHFGEA